MAGDLLVINADGPETRVALDRKGAARRALHRAAARARHRRQHLQGAGRARAAGHAGGVRRHRRREGGVPLRRRRARRARGLQGAVRRLRRRRRDNRTSTRRASGDAARIEDLLKEGQEIIVQVAKEPIGTKGARSTRVRLAAGAPPGVHADRRPRRHLAAHRLRQGAPAAARDRRVDAPGGRRASSCAPSPRACSEKELQADMEFLIKLWNAILQQNAERQGAGAALQRPRSAAAHGARSVHAATSTS